MSVILTTMDSLPDSCFDCMLHDSDCHCLASKDQMAAQQVRPYNCPLRDISEIQPEQKVPSVLRQLNDELNNLPEEELFGVLYKLAQIDNIIDEDDPKDEDALDKLFEDVKTYFNSGEVDKAWFQQSIGRFDRFLAYIHKRMLCRYHLIHVYPDGTAG